MEVANGLRCFRSHSACLHVYNVSQHAVAAAWPLPGCFLPPALVPHGLQVTSKFADKDAALVVGCKSGKRSEAACELMHQAGYKRLVNMPGGFDGWVAEQLPVEK
jgi:rhodanese-related sulfurtransferase